MNWNKLSSDLIDLLHQYESLGPLPGVLLPLLEAFIPVLPLMAIIIGNAAAYGLWLGFLYSWIGVNTGSVLLFLLARRYSHAVNRTLHRRAPKSRVFFDWIERKGFMPLFIMSCIPFSPTFLINVVAGLTRIRFPVYLAAILTGKAFMIFFISYVGYDIFTLFAKPGKLVFVSLVLLLLWFAGRLFGMRQSH